MDKIGAIGMGFVGKAIYSSFKMSSNYKVYGHDIDREKSLNSYADAVNSDFVFICLPTPSRKDGSCDDSLIIDFLHRYFEFMTNSNEYQQNDKRIFIIKSTVPVGTTWYLQKRSNEICEKFGKDTVNFVHSPEFLSAKTALHDFMTATRHIVGDSRGAFGDFECAERVADLYGKRFQNSRVIVMK